MENYIKLWWDEAVKFLSINWGEARRGEMMVNYLFPLTDKSPAPLRLSWPDSWQAEEGVNVTGGPGTQNGLAMAFQLLPIQTLTSWPRELVRAPTMTWGPPTHFWPRPNSILPPSHYAQKAAPPPWSSSPKSLKLTSLFFSPFSYLT